MDYFERLILRALARPRAAAPDVFDPFEQVAHWDLDEAPPTERIHPPAVGEAPRAVPQSAAPASSPAPHAAIRPGVEQPAAVPQAPPREPAGAPAGRAAVSVVPQHAAPSQSLPIASPAADPLARADAFMRTLGVRPVAADVPHRPKPEPVDVPQRHEQPRSETPPRAPAPQPAGPVLLRPAPPPPAPHQPGMATGEHVRPGAAPATPAAPSPAAKRPAPAEPPAGRIVHTTVVVAPSARRLDDLAHGSAITRFGIGQG
jgi:hypothetical protein